MELVVKVYTTSLQQKNFNSVDFAMEQMRRSRNRSTYKSRDINTMIHTPRNRS